MHLTLRGHEGSNPSVSAAMVPADVLFAGTVYMLQYDMPGLMLRHVFYCIEARYFPCEGGRCGLSVLQKKYLREEKK